MNEIGEVRKKDEKIAGNTFHPQEYNGCMISRKRDRLNLKKKTFKRWSAVVRWQVSLHSQYLNTPNNVT